jgi:hypothetical protein
MVYTSRSSSQLLWRRLASRAQQGASNSLKRKPDISIVVLPRVIVDGRLHRPDIVLNTLEELSERYGVPILPTIRTDTAVVKAGRHRKFLVEFDPNPRLSRTTRRRLTSCWKSSRNELMQRPRSSPKPRRSRTEDELN